MLVKTIKIMATALLALSLNLSADEAWLPQASGFEATSRGIRGIFPVNADTVWAMAYDGSEGGVDHLLEYTKTENGGTLWVPGKVSFTGDDTYGLGNISPVSSTKAWAAVYPTSTPAACGVYATADGGATWTKQTTATQYNTSDAFPNVVHMFDEMNGFTMGDPSLIPGDTGKCFEIYTTADGGVTWIRVPKANIAAGVNPTSGEYGTVNVFSAVGSSTAWFGTNKGKMLKTTDKGLTWSINTTAAPTGKGITEVEFRDENNGILVYNNGTSTAAVYKLRQTTDGGATWTDLAATGLPYVSGLSYVPGTEKTWVVASAKDEVKGSYFSKDDGATWTAFDEPIVQLTDVAFVNPTTGWAGSFNDPTDPMLGGMYEFALDLSDVGINGSDNQPSSVALMQNYPNPFNPTTTISFEVKSAGSVKLSIFDAAGKMVSELVNGTVTAGLHNVEFNAANLNSGVYFYKLQTAGISQTKKMMLVK